MFALLFDSYRRVLLARFFGSLDVADLDLHRSLRRRFIELEGDVATIVDLMAVERVLVPTMRANVAARTPSSLLGQTRVVAATPGSEAFGLARLFSTIRDVSGHAAPVLVATVEEAFRLLELTDPDFRPWPPGRNGETASR